MTIAIQVIDLVQEFKLGEIIVSALRGVSFEIKKGEFVCLFGPSGSGKSTLLNLIGGLDRFTAGKIIVDGQDVGLLNEVQLAKYRQRTIGFVFQSYNLIPTLTALQNVEYPLIFAGVSPAERRTKALKALEAVKLGHRLAHKPTELSGGEQQRVSIARAIINQPLVILADEPTGNLDTKTGQKIMGLLKEMNIENKQTFIIVTHDSDVSQYADRILFIKDGLLVGGN